MKRKICGIYKIGSKVHSDRCYIGSAVDIKRRWYRHKKDLREQTHNPILQAHYNKYGLDDLIFSVIDSFDFISKEHILEKEQFYIDTDPLNAYFCVNKTAGSCMGVKRVFTEEHKKHMSEARKGIIFTEEHKKNISKNRRGIRGVIKKKNPNFHVNSGSWEKGHAPWNKGKKTGRIPWNKGKKMGKAPKTAFKKGFTPWNKGLTKETDERVAEVGRTIKRSRERNKKQKGK